MRSFLIALCVLLHTISFAQKAVPVIDNRPLTKYASAEDMISVEGYRNGAAPVTQTVALSGTVLTGTASTTFVGGGVLPGFVVYNTGGGTGFSFGAINFGKAARFMGGKVLTNGVQASGTYFLGATPGTKTVNPGFGSGIWSTPFNGGSDDIPPGGIIRFQQQGLSTRISAVTTPWTSTSAPVVGSVQALTITGTSGFEWIEATDDLNYTAPYVLRLIGDSKLWGSGVTETVNMVGFQVRNFYRSKGYDIRLQNFAISGSTADQHEYTQLQGKYNNAAKGSLVWIDLGTNNYASVPDSVANIVSRIALRELIANPNAYVVVQAMNPRNDVAARETAMGLISTSTQTKIAQLKIQLKASPVKFLSDLADRLFYCGDTRTMWTATDATKYADGLHPNDAGNAIWSATIINWLNTNVPALPLPYRTNNIGWWILLFLPLRRRHRFA